MNKLLELTKRQTLILSAVTVVLGVALIVAMGVFVAAQSNSAKQAFGTLPTPTAQESDQVITETEKTSDGQQKTIHDTQAITKFTPQTKSNDKPVKPSQQPNKQPATQQKPAQKPAQAKSNPVGETITKAVDGVEYTVRGVTYTLKHVVPGDPMSYVDTYGQCPFYEAVGAKGCWPPSNLTCNADWSICKLRD